MQETDCRLELPTHIHHIYIRNLKTILYLSASRHANDNVREP